MITLFGYPRTRSTRIAWALEELELPYQYQVIDFDKGDHRSEEFLAINPAGKVPAIRDEKAGLTLLESGAIIRYLAAKAPKKNLLPQDPALQALCDQWCYFAQAELEQPLWTIGKNKFALPREHRCAEIFPTAAYEFQQALKLLSKELGDKPFILGDNFSLADILLGHVLFWGEGFKQEIPQENLQVYKEKLKERPALRRAAKAEHIAVEKLKESEEA